MTDDYTITYHEAKVKGMLMFTSLQQEKLTLRMIGDTSGGVKVSELGVPTVKKRMQNVKNKNICTNNFKGILQGRNSCVNYSLLKEICLVVQKSVDGQWSLFRDPIDPTKYLGCHALETSRIGLYEKVISVKS